MRKILFIAVFYPLSIFSQNPNPTKEELLSLKFAPWKLNTENVINSYLNYDFSELVIPKTKFLGYIGSNYKRIIIEYKTVRKTQKSNEYLICGISIVGNNKCDFTGKLRIIKVQEFNSLHYGADEIYKDKGIKKQGILIAEYRLEENKSQNHAGIFEGIFTLNWYLDTNADVKYDDIEIHSDSYCNNQYIGLWTEFGITEGKICNWGEFRIPNSKDLDIGAGEFYPSSKYKEYGWQDYK